MTYMISALAVSFSVLGATWVCAFFVVHFELFKSQYGFMWVLTMMFIVLAVYIISTETIRKVNNRLESRRRR